jgi:hypothetical protein
VISYRPLTRQDFKSALAPPAFRAYADRIGAATCAYVQTVREAQFLARPVAAVNKQVEFHSEARNLRFEAAMNRRCSWWNTRQTQLPEPYVLEHEQIHFAIFELESRKLNAQLDRIAERLRAVAPTGEAAGSETQRKLLERLEEARRDIMDRSNRFDEDTSYGYEPEKQKEWLRRVESELAATTRYASAPIAPVPPIAPAPAAAGASGPKLPRAPE